jgi:D-alanine-D-alanine ligase
VEPELVRRIQRLALEAYDALGCRSYARVDFREDREGNLQILEVNPNPDFAPSAGLAKQARAHGWDYPELTFRVLGAAEVNEPWT